MQLQIVALDMRYSFETKTTTNIMRAVLPTGRHLEFEVTEAEIAALIETDSVSVPSNWTAPDEYLPDAVARWPLDEEPLDEEPSPSPVSTKPKAVDLGVVERGVPLPSRPRSRRIESDERGNPMVQQSQSAPLEDADEDTGARSI